MPKVPVARYPKNAPGDFYVEDQVCITCEAPRHTAPELIAHDDDEDAYPHCYFRRQPKTPQETERAIMACDISCCDALRYGGSDPVILQRFRELGRLDLCDAPGLFPNLRGLFPPIGAPPPSDDRSHPLWDLDLDG